MSNPFSVYPRLAFLYYSSLLLVRVSLVCENTREHHVYVRLFTCRDEYVSRPLFHRNPPVLLISEAVHHFFCLKFNETKLEKWNKKFFPAKGFERRGWPRLHSRSIAKGRRRIKGVDTVLYKHTRIGCIALPLSDRILFN